MSRRRTGATLAALLLTLLALASPALAVAPKTSITDISDEVMCVVCGIPLNVAESPQAERERAYIQTMIDKGLTKDQIKTQLIAEYGQAVIADPGSKGGIAITTWLVPLLLLVAALGALAIFVPRWRRKRVIAGSAEAWATTPDAPAGAGAPLDEASQQRLDEDLARYR
jgi:cytochrome c-type biogenesis protein CcmH